MGHLGRHDRDVPFPTDPHSTASAASAASSSSVLSKNLSMKPVVSLSRVTSEQIKKFQSLHSDATVDRPVRDRQVRSGRSYTGDGSADKRPDAGVLNRELLGLQTYNHPGLKEEEVLSTRSSSRNKLSSKRLSAKYKRSLMSSRQSSSLQSSRRSTLSGRPTLSPRSPTASRLLAQSARPSISSPRSPTLSARSSVLLAKSERSPTLSARLSTLCARSISRSVRSSELNARLSTLRSRKPISSARSSPLSPRSSTASIRSSTLYARSPSKQLSTLSKRSSIYDFLLQEKTGKAGSNRSPSTIQSTEIHTSTSRPPGKTPKATTDKPRTDRKIPPGLSVPDDGSTDKTPDTRVSRRELQGLLSHNNPGLREEARSTRASTSSSKLSTVSKRLSTLHKRSSASSRRSSTLQLSI